MEPRAYLERAAAALESCVVVSASLYPLAEMIVNSRGVYLIGNGGSMAQAQHLAAELTVRFRRERAGIEAVAVGADPVYLSAMVNDYGPEGMFTRFLDSALEPGSVVIVLSTSCRSTNLEAIFDVAKQYDATTVLIGGNGGGDFAGLADLEIIVPETDTAIIQDCHSALCHALMYRVEALLC
jgi:D-sedoheptulose 7-phosphate isomerase